MSIIPLINRFAQKLRAENPNEAIRNGTDPEFKMQPLMVDGVAVPGAGTSEEWLLDQAISKIIGKMADGSVTKADRDRYDALTDRRVSLMLPPVFRKRHMALRAAIA